jgi:two-component system, NarL family, sensor histidine kinase DesK
MAANREKRLRDYFKYDFKIQDSVGTLTWLLVFGLSMRMLENADAAILANKSWIVLCFIGYFVSFIGASRDFKGRLAWRWQKAFFASQLLFAFAILWMLPLDFLPILTIIWSAVSLKYFKPWQAVVATTAVVIIWFSIYGIHWEQRSAMYSALLYFSFHIFALMMSLQTLKAEQATAEAQALNTELKATRELLAESTKMQERTRIARELHDLLGHHMTALNINLQVASHLLQHDKPINEIKKPVEQSYFLAKLLLSDVRDAVSTIRENQHVDLSNAINLIQSSFPNLTINFAGEPLDSEHIHFAHDLLRCIQEAVTNAVKHGQATEVNISLTQKSLPHRNLMSDSNDADNVNMDNHVTDSLELRISNNGLKPTSLAFGNGLKGMQERVSTYGGQVAIDLEQNEFSVTLLFPIDNLHFRTAS